MPPALASRSISKRSPTSSPGCMEDGLLEAHRRLVDQVVDDGLHVAGLAVDLDLLVRARPLFEDPAHVIQLVLRAEDVRRLADEVEQLADQLAGRDLLLLAEIDQLTVDAVAHRAPLVLLDELAAVLA